MGFFDLSLLLMICLVLYAGSVCGLGLRMEFGLMFVQSVRSQAGVLSPACTTHPRSLRGVNFASSKHLPSTGLSTDITE